MNILYTDQKQTQHWSFDSVLGKCLSYIIIDFLNSIIIYIIYEY